MGSSRAFKKEIDSFTDSQIDRIIRMCWQDRTTFEAIYNQFGLSENQVVKLMRSQLPHSTFLRWRKRIHYQGKLKHGIKCGIKITRFKCSRQTVDGFTKGWK